MKVVGVIRVSRVDLIDGAKGIDIKCDDTQTFGTGERGGNDANCRVIKRRAAVRLDQEDIEKLVGLLIQEKLVQLPATQLRTVKRKMPRTRKPVTR